MIHQKEMIVVSSTQSDVIKFLSDGASYGMEEPVEIIETHISMVFLVGQRAFKLKKSVKFPYVDFSDAPRRLDACFKEVALNSLTAPELYVGVKRLSKNEKGHICFAADGPLLDAVVEMVRFDQDLLFDRLAAANKLTDPLMTATARMLVHFHEAASPVHDHDGLDQMEAVLTVNEAGFKASKLFDENETGVLCMLFRKTLERHAERLRERANAGKIKRCHGDLHLRNICLIKDQPRLFDCIEFNDEIATIDVLYDLAFLLMDLWHEGHDHHANLVMNRYLDESDNEDGFILLPFFLAVRAAVRAHVIAMQAQAADINKQVLCLRAISYFELAHQLLKTELPRLVAIGGLSGSGKTTIAEALAPSIGIPPGARIIESDRIRKSLHGVPADVRLPKAAYKPAISDRVYAEIVLRTQIVLADGGCVVADAVFGDVAQRRKIEAAAIDKSIRFNGFWLDADPDVLWRRVHSRHGGPSDANVDVLQLQLARQTGDINWYRIDVSKSINQCCDEITSVLTPTWP